MRQNTEAPKEVTDPRLDKEERRFEHPAYGIARITRVSGQKTLFGSDVKHQHFIRFSISEATAIRRYHSDSTYEKRPLIEIDLSELQFASLIASMNLGSGVPCTIHYAEKEHRAGLPGTDKNETFRKEFNEKTAEVKKSIKEGIEQVDEILKGVSEKKKKEIRWILEKLLQDVTSNLPFVEKQFKEHIEEVSGKAKAEFAAFVQSEVQRMGLASARQTAKARETPPLLLEDQE